MNYSTAILSVKGREIPDLRANPTVEVDVRLSGGFFGRAAVPSGASTGTREALELRNKNARRYGPKGVQTAVANVGGPLAAALLRLDATDLQAVDRALIAADGTPDKSRLGANAILGASITVARAAAAAGHEPVYRNNRWWNSRRRWRLVSDPMARCTTHVAAGSCRHCCLPRGVGRPIPARSPESKGAGLGPFGARRLCSRGAVAADALFSLGTQSRYFLLLQ